MSIQPWLFCLFAMILYTQGKDVRLDEICGEFNGRRMYLDLDEHGVLQAKNQSREGVAWRRNERNHQQCSLELITCPSCIIKVKFIFLNISRNCGKTPILDSCGCDYVWIYEPPFEDVSGEQFCGHFVDTNTSSMTYKSQTRSTAITFLYTSYHQHAFTLEYSSKRSRHHFEGYPRYLSLNTGIQYIASPFFPYFYPRDLNTEYVITCKSSENCRVRLIFTDFQLSSSSLIEFFDWNGHRMYVSTGTIFRPPLLISTGPSMAIRFYANGGSSYGFKASYKFLLGDKDNSTLKPNTDCGGYVENLGGRITMMDMMKEHTKAYDCFWIIRPPENYLHLKTQLYLKVIEFSDFAGTTELTIRQGLTSNEAVVEVLKHPILHNMISKRKEHIVPISQGFYISLKGLFRAESRLAIVYTAFNYKDCFSGSDFLCRNLRCIPMYLICDGFDHCGDNSDETTNCLDDLKDRLRWSHTPNFFFPKIDRYSYLKTATIVFVVCSLGLFCLIFTFIVLLYRINLRNRTHRHLQTHLQTINDMLEEGPSSVTEVEIQLDEPPLYEAPPDYNDVLKMAKKKERRKTGFHKRPCSRCDNSSIDQSITNSDANEDDSICVDLFGTNRSSQTTPLPGCLPPTPESPPPSYTLLDPDFSREVVPSAVVDCVEDLANNCQLDACCSTTYNIGGFEHDNIPSIIVDIDSNTTNIENAQEIRQELIQFSAEELFVSQDVSKRLSLQNIKIVEDNLRRFESAGSIHITGILSKPLKSWSPMSVLASRKKSFVSDSNLLMSLEFEDRAGYNFIPSARYTKGTTLQRSVSFENLFKY